MVDFQVLGSLCITENGEAVSVGGPRQRRLLSMLLIHHDTVVSLDRLAEAVFAGEPTPEATTTLRSYVARLRKSIDGSAVTIETRAPGYVLRLPDGAFDAVRFEQLLDEAANLLGRGDAVGAAMVARDALGLWRGDAYAEFADEEWALPEAQRLEERRLVAHERLFEAELACGRADEVLPEVERLVDEHPLREAFRAQLMLALYRTGRHADALAAYREHRDVLVEELGLEPTPTLSELEGRILNHDPSLMVDEPAGRPLRGYRLGARLGTGRDGTVYAARLPDIDRDYAIRVIRPEVANRPEFVRSFEALAHRIASLDHPAIVPIHDYWREPGAAYLVMRRTYGGTLADRLDRGTVTSTDVTALVERVGGALARAAERGIVHGRVAAESVLYDGHGECLLSDFAFDTDRPATVHDDVYEFAVLVRRCLRRVDGPVAEVLDSAVATVGRPAMGELVARLRTALEGEADVEPRSRPNPFKGLRAFDEADATDFFGRTALVDEIVARLGRDDLTGRLVLVVGGSGTGKSSVVRAGVLPRVRRGGAPGSSEWFVTTMLPGSTPFKELAEGLRRVAVDDPAGLADDLAENGGIDRVLRRLVPESGQLLLVVDQFEELFTMATAADQRAFLDGIVDAVSADDSRLRVVATLRADFCDRPLASQRFGPLVNGATVMIAALSAAELEAAIVGPVERVGGDVDPALVAELVKAVADQPAALPSLQFTLFELAEKSPDKRLGLAAYREIGGVDGAIAARADALYRALDDTERAAVKAMFERLAVVAPDGAPTRRRALRSELVAVDPSAADAVDRWADARLLTLDCHPQTRAPTVELAHEALLREWPRLRGWIEEDREALVVLGQLREAARDWNDLGRDPDVLYRGTRLQVADDVTAARPDDVPALEEEFLAASRDERDREESEAAERVARQVRANRRLRIQMAVIAAALVVALIGGFIALDQRRTAQNERVLATARELAAASDASLDEDPERSILLALAAIDATRSRDGTVLPEAEEALRRAVGSSRIVLNVPGLGGTLDWSPDGTTFVTEGPEDTGIIDIRDAETGESVRSWIGHDVDINDVAFSADGSMLATAGDDGAVRVWDPATGALVSEFVGDVDGIVWGPTFSPDGSRLAASWTSEALVRVIDPRAGEVVTEIPAEGVHVIAFDSDGSRLAFGDGVEPTGAIVVDATSGDEVFTAGRGEFSAAVAWSPDGSFLATGDSLGEIDLWDASSGEHRFTVSGHTVNVNRMDWSADSARLASASYDGTAKVWEIAEAGARELVSVVSHDTRNGVWDVALSPDGERLMTGDVAISSVKIWDVSATGGGEWRNVAGVPFAPYAVAFTPDGSGVISSTGNGAVTVWDLATGAARRTIGPALHDGAGDVFAIIPSPDGDLLMTVVEAVEGVRVEVWDFGSGEHRFTVPAGPALAWVSWSADGKLLAVAEFGDDGSRVVIVDASGEVVATVREEPGHEILSVNFSPDGTLLATTRHSERVAPTSWAIRIWDWRQGTVVRTIQTRSNYAAFDPTGTRLVSLRGFESLADIWDVETGERVATLTGHVERFFGVVYSHDGSTLATTSGDGTARLWDADTGAERLVLDTGGSRLGAAVFSPDDSMLATVGDDDGLVRVWALDLDDLIAIAHDRLTRGFTDDECRRYLHLERCPERETPA